MGTVPSVSAYLFLPIFALPTVRQVLTATNAHWAAAVYLQPVVPYLPGQLKACKAARAPPFCLASAAKGGSTLLVPVLAGHRAAGTRNDEKGRGEEKIRTWTRVCVCGSRGRQYLEQVLRTAGTMEAVRRHVHGGACTLPCTLHVPWSGTSSMAFFVR